jgi:hypothetical protein
MVQRWLSAGPAGEAPMADRYGHAGSPARVRLSGMDPEPSLARRLWQAVEPLHAVVYFDPAPAAEARRVGLKGWWMGYFAGRFAPLGAITPGPATAMAFGFSPGMVARSLPDAWALASPEAVLTGRQQSAASALRALLPGEETTLAELGDLLAEAVTGCRFDGRPLAAGWAGAAVPDDPWARLWLLASVLREHRGDGHVLAAVALGLSGLEASVTNVATGAVTRDLLQPNRGWTDDEWDDAVRRLQGRGLLLPDGGLTAAGVELRGQLEETTDRLAAEPVERLGPDGTERIVALATPLARRVIDDGPVPVPNPIGVPRP